MKLPLVVTPGDSPNLLGRNWPTRIKIDWNQVFCVNQVSQDQSPQEIEDLQEEFKGVFRPELGTFKNVRVKIELQEGAEPKFMKTSPLCVEEASGERAGKLKWEYMNLTTFKMGYSYCSSRGDQQAEVVWGLQYHSKSQSEVRQLPSAED